MSLATSGTGMPSRDRFDWALFVTAALISVVGIVNLYSATSVAKAALSEIYLNQVYWFVAGGILAIVVTFIDYRHLERLGYVLYAIGIVLLLLVFVLGRDIRGSSRWIAIGSFGFQPSEFMKLFLAIAIAKYLHDDPRAEGRTLKDLIAPAVLTVIPVLLVLKQPDLGTGLILTLMFLSAMALTRIKLRTILTILTGAAVAAPLMWTYGLRDYQRNRITSFLDPEADIIKTGWHAHQARIAIGNGSLFGQGYMKGTQNQYLFIPEQHTDFPFPVFAEDWGFVGCLVLFSLYAFLILWSIRIASHAKTRFGAVLAVCIGAMIFWHTFFNIGMVIGILPVVGVTLPLFSYGGSSVITIMIGLGLLMNISIRRQ